MAGREDALAMLEAYLTGDPALLPKGAAAGGGDTAKLDAIRADIGDCKRCGLCDNRTHIVFGAGSPDARVVFIGEAPGEEEDKQGVPFVGRSGQLLTQLITTIGLTRDEVYIANICKCRPPGNRNPQPDEVAACEPFLKRQLAAIGPKVICGLGNVAVQTLMRTKVGITKLRGQVLDYAGIPLVPTFHPSFILRSGGMASPNMGPMMRDFERLRDMANG